MIKVMKFGGGCLRDQESLFRAVQIIKNQNSKIAVVVSAIQGVTDLLYECLKKAVEEKGNFPAAFDKIRSKHEELVRGCLFSKELLETLLKHFSLLFSRLEKFLLGISYTGEITPHLRAQVLSFGERLSAYLLTWVIKDKGLKARVYETDKAGLITENVYENASVKLREFDLLFEPVAREILNGDFIPVFTGFFGATAEGKVSIFGRNGSDYSAAVIARGLKAKSLEIWKDVPGFLTSDPRIIPEATLLSHLSWKEASELSYFGARILHPRTREPLENMDIVVDIKSFSSPESKGTVISLKAERIPGIVKSISLNPEIAVLKISGPGVGDKPGIIGKVGSTLADSGINILTVLTSQTCINLILAIDQADRAEKALREINEEAIQRIEVEKNLSLLAVVGEGIRETSGVAERLFSILSRAEVNLEFFSSGASDVAIYLIVRKEEATAAIKALHQACFEHQEIRSSS